LFAQLVQNATEVKYLPDDFIISSIDEENNSLLHDLVVWGYDAGIHFYCLFVQFVKYNFK
jgi:hypothetical protein